MDERRFDQLTKSLAGAASRRSVIKTLTGGALGGVLSLIGRDRVRADNDQKDEGCDEIGQRCDKNRDCCTGKCKDRRCVCRKDNECKDDNPCTKDICREGQCVHDPIPGCCRTDAECDDEDPCTKDACRNGQCVHKNIRNCCHTDADCDDGNACTDDDCIDNRCVHQDVNCDDGDPCTEDTCDPATGCQYADVPNDPPVSCDPDDPTRVCVDGVCGACLAVTEGPCQTNLDCCGALLCGVNGAVRRCICREQGEECLSNGDCCPEAGACMKGRCGGCVGLFATDTCLVDAECCNNTCSNGGMCEQFPNGSTCEAGVDCQSLNCEGGVCAPCHQPGDTCSRQFQCCGGHCVNEVCCRGQNFSCTGSTDCCAGLTCAGGTCQ